MGAFFVTNLTLNMGWACLGENLTHNMGAFLCESLTSNRGAFLGKNWMHNMGGLFRYKFNA